MAPAAWQAARRELALALQARYNDGSHLDLSLHRHCTKCQLQIPCQVQLLKVVCQSSNDPKGQIGCREAFCSGKHLARHAEKTCQKQATKRRQETTSKAKTRDAQRKPIVNIANETQESHKLALPCLVPAHHNSSRSSMSTSRVLQLEMTAQAGELAAHLCSHVAPALLSRCCRALDCHIQRRHSKQEWLWPVIMNGMSNARVVVYIVEGVFELVNQNVGRGDDAGRGSVERGAKVDE